MHQWDNFFLRIARDRTGGLLMSGTHSQNPPPSSTQSSPLGRHKEYWVQLDQLGNRLCFPLQFFLEFERNSTIMAFDKRAKVPVSPRLCVFLERARYRIITCWYHLCQPMSPLKSAHTFCIAIRSRTLPQPFQLFRECQCWDMLEYLGCYECE